MTLPSERRNREREGASKDLFLDEGNLEIYTFEEILERSSYPDVLSRQ